MYTVDRKILAQFILVGPVSSVGRVLDITMYNQVMGSSSPGWDCWSLGFMPQLTLHSKEVKNGTRPDSETQL